MPDVGAETVSAIVASLQCYCVLSQLCIPALLLRVPSRHLFIYTSSTKVIQ